MGKRSIAGLHGRCADLRGCRADADAQRPLAQGARAPMHAEFPASRASCFMLRHG